MRILRFVLGDQLTRSLGALRDLDPSRLGVGGHRGFIEPAVAAGVREPGEELGVVAVAVGLAKEPDHRLRRPTDVGLQVGVVLVRDAIRRFLRQTA
jgi:hypothetical protein